MTTATARVDPRIRARRVAVTRAAGRRRLRVLVAGVLAVAAAAGVWLTVTSPLLDVDRIVVTGSPLVPEEQVREAAGVETGDALLLLDLGRIESRVEAVPTVGDAHVTRDLPDELRIAVVPRIAAAWVRREGGDVAVVDDTGMVIADVAQPPADLPELRGVTTLPEAGAPIAPAVATGVLDALPAGLREQLAGVVVMGGAVALELTDGVEVRLGPPRDVEAKGRTAQAVREALGGAQVAYIDVRVPAAPVTG